MSAGAPTTGFFEPNFGSKRGRFKYPPEYLMADDPIWRDPPVGMPSIYTAPPARPSLVRRILGALLPTT